MFFFFFFFFIFFFFNDTATTEIYTLSLHDALPICYIASQLAFFQDRGKCAGGCTCVSALRFLSRYAAPAHGRASESSLRSSSAQVGQTARHPPWRSRSPARGDARA